MSEDIKEEKTENNTPDTQNKVAEKNTKKRVNKKKSDSDNTQLNKFPRRRVWPD